MSSPTPTATIQVDVTNPAHYFACCALLELASRLAPESAGCFEKNAFHLIDSPTLSEVIDSLTSSVIVMVDPSDDTASPIYIPEPFNLLLDWWKSNDRASSDLKVWAGTMDSFRIAKAMQSTMRQSEFFTDNLLNIGAVAFDADDPSKKVEPFYFDARRGPNAHSRDVGFAPNDLKMTTVASPAAELLCLIGLQRVRPTPAGKNKQRQFTYQTWTHPIPAMLAPIAASGLLSDTGSKTYLFESWYRTGQRKHKAFLSAKQINQSNTP